jgi:hypothetical protein
MKAQDDTMKKLVILIVGLLVIQVLVGTMVASAAPGIPCPGPGCGGSGYLRDPGLAYYPYQGLLPVVTHLGMGQPSQVYYRYNYLKYPAFKPYVPAFYWWEYPYYPGGGTRLDNMFR